MKGLPRLSFPEYVVGLFQDVYYDNEFKKRQQLLDSHAETHNIPDTTSFELKYRTFRVQRLSGQWTESPLVLLPTEDLKEEIKIYLQSHTTFLYDMDKIRNFLSYMVRYASQKDFMDKYIPSNLTESYNFREIHFNKLPIEYVDKTIEAKFSEEIKLIKRYYLTYRIYTMR